MKYTPTLARLIDSLRCLPGVGPKSAQRMAFYLLERDRDGGRTLSQALAEALQQVGHCKRCRMLTESELCSICASTQRDPAGHSPRTAVQYVWPQSSSFGISAEHDPTFVVTPCVKLRLGGFSSTRPSAISALTVNVCGPFARL